MTSRDLPPDLLSNHIETYYAEVSKLALGGITHDLSALVCPEFNMFQYGVGV